MWTEGCRVLQLILHTAQPRHLVHRGPWEESEPVPTPPLRTPSIRPLLTIRVCSRLKNAAAPARTALCAPRALVSKRHRNQVARLASVPGLSPPSTSEHPLAPLHGHAYRQPRAPNYESLEPRGQTDCRQCPSPRRSSFRCLRHPCDWKLIEPTQGHPGCSRSNDGSSLMLS